MSVSVHLNVICHQKLILFTRLNIAVSRCRDSSFVIVHYIFSFFFVIYFMFLVACARLS